MNNIWGGYEQYDPKLFQLPLWEQPLWRWDKMMRAGVRAHYTSSRALVPLMFESDLKRLLGVTPGRLRDSLTQG